MTGKVFLTFGLVAILAALCSCASTAKFKSFDTTKSGDPQIIRGKLTKPSGDGPFPAVVLLHGSAGIKGAQELYSSWIYRLRKWGYVSLMVDSFSTRGVDNISGPGKSFVVSPHRRAQDAHAAKKYLESLPCIDPNRIAVMGWSHGGETTLHVVQINVPSSTPFQAAIAYYPHCVPLYILNSPLLVLIGEKDDWTPANLCEYYLQSKKGWPELTLHVYSKAFHSFDAPYGLRYIHGHRLEPNEFATLDSRNRVKAFLKKYLMDN